LPFAYRKALSLLKTKRYDAVFATIGPYSTGVLAYYLHKNTNIPYFIDYRDQWTLENYRKYNFSLLKKQARYYEHKILKNALGVVGTSNLRNESLIKHFGEFLRSKIINMYNGYDEDDFIHTILKDKNNGFNQTTIRYVGTFCGNRTPYYFVNTIKSMYEKNNLPNNIIIEFIGNYHREALDLLNSLPYHIKVIPQVNHSEAVNLMQTADLLLLFISSKDGDEFMPGKVCEYLRARVPILAMIPVNGEPANILKEYNHKMICDMENTNQIETLLNEFLINKESFICNIMNDISKYSRECQTDILNEFLEKKLFSLNK
jgi:glycosyltransferase involved in cell wall biosynthesis